MHTNLNRKQAQYKCKSHWCRIGKKSCLSACRTQPFRTIVLRELAGVIVLKATAAQPASLVLRYRSKAPFASQTSGNNAICIVRTNVRIELNRTICQLSKFVRNLDCYVLRRVEWVNNANRRASLWDCSFVEICDMRTNDDNKLVLESVDCCWMDLFTVVSHAVIDIVVIRLYTSIVRPVEVGSVCSGHNRRIMQYSHRKVYFHFAGMWMISRH